MHPQIRAGALGHSLAPASGTKVLAGCAAAKNVHMFDRVPVNGGHVTMIGNARPVARHNPGRCRVELAVPLEFGAKHFLHGKTKTAVASAELGIGEAHAAFFRVTPRYGAQSRQV